MLAGISVKDLMTTLHSSSYFMTYITVGKHCLSCYISSHTLCYDSNHVYLSKWLCRYKTKSQHHFWLVRFLFKLPCQWVVSTTLYYSSYFVILQQVNYVVARINLWCSNWTVLQKLFTVAGGSISALLMKKLPQPSVETITSQLYRAKVPIKLYD